MISDKISNILAGNKWFTHSCQLVTRQMTKLLYKMELSVFRVVLTLATIVVSTTAQPRAVNPNDPLSFSNPEEIRAENIDFKWNVDFEKKIVSGSIVYNLIANKTGVKNIILDTRDIKIHSVKDSEGNRLQYEIGEVYLFLGKPLNISLPSFVPDINGTVRGNIVIEYETSPNSSALQWMEKEQTGEKEFPFLYSQSEAIHARSLFPCQDTPFTKSTYRAAVTAPKEAAVLFSAISTGNPVDTGNNTREHFFVQNLPVQSYLVAIAVGKLESAVIGPRTTVWAEKSLIADAAFDFSETEAMVQAAESIVGEYPWGPYDILVLPPSFPLGGMENPCVTFTTPTLLTGDKSLANVIAHEIAHTWTGNLVTNKNFDHFWLNEGFTVFLERKMMGIMSGELARQFDSIEGWATLEETVETFGKESPMTKLVLDLREVDPDDALSKIAYEKGYVFLYYLEEKVGGAAVMNGFLRQYVKTFQFKSIDTSEFKDYFIQYFEGEGKGDLIKDIDWDDWFYTPGVPKIKPNYDTTLYDAVAILSSRWLTWNETTTPNPFSPSDLTNFSATQIQVFLQTFLSSNNNTENETLSIGKVKAMEETYKLNSYRNGELRYRWLRIGIKAKWLDQLPLALQFVTDLGRMKFIRPIYRDLYDWNEEVRAEAIATFLRNRPYMMYMSINAVAHDLHLDE